MCQADNLVFATGDQTGRLQVGNDLPDFRSGVGSHQTVGAEFLQARLQQPLVPAAPKHSDDHGDGSAVTQDGVYPVNAGEHHLGFFCDILCDLPPRTNRGGGVFFRFSSYRCRGAVPAVSTPACLLLAEIGQNELPQAAGCLAVVYHFI